MTVLADNRKFRAMTADEADKIMEEIASLRCRAEVLRAAGEKKIAAVKSSTLAAIEPLETQIAALEAELAEYISANPSRFQKTRSRKTPFGSYGLRTVSNVEITDENAVIEYAKLHNLPLYTVIFKVDKKAVEKALVEGTLPDGCGAEIRTGELTRCDVAKSLLDKAKRGDA